MLVLTYSTYTKIRTIQRRLAWPLRKESEEEGKMRRRRKRGIGRTEEEIG